MNQSYSMLFAPQLITGRGSVSFIKTLERKKIGIIRGGRSYSDELRAIIESAAEETGAEICYLAQIRNEPFVEDIFTCMDKVRAFEPDLILAVGGGSVLDTAKALHLFYENPELSFEQALIPFTLPKLGKKAIHVAIPTTSGTGSEATSVAVFIDRDTKTKKLLLDHTLIPHYAILDANTTDSLPDSIRIATALDALTHAIESGTAQNASSLTRALALEAAADILENLPAAIDPGISAEKSQAAREKLHIASALAGIAITNSCTGIAHSYDHPGPEFSLPHGVVCGLMLPYTMQLCGIQDSYLTLSKRLGYKGTEKELVQLLIDHLFSLMKSLSLKTSFKEMHIDKDHYFAKVPVWSEISLNAFATAVSPAQMTPDTGAALYRACYYGETLNT